MTILRSGFLTRVVVDTGVVVTYGGPNLIQIAIPASHRKMCGLCGNISSFDAGDTGRPNGSIAMDSSFASSWSISTHETNCSQKCEHCPECSSTVTAAFSADNLCGMLLAPAGSFGGCHATVDPQPFFQNCVNDLCLSNGNEDLLCSSLREYVFACQDAGAEVKPWRGEKCCEYYLSWVLSSYVATHQYTPTAQHALLWGT